MQSGPPSFKMRSKDICPGGGKLPPTDVTSVNLLQRRNWVSEMPGTGSPARLLANPPKRKSALAVRL